MKSLLSLYLIATCASSLFAAENWPQFRGPNGNGIVEAKNPPIRWSEKENILWKTAIHGKAWSSPVVWGDVVWVTSATPDGKELYAISLDKKTGKILHDLKIFTVAKPQFCHEYNSYASSTPTIEEGRVYVHFGSPGTACLDAKTGKVLWERRDLECDHFRGAGSSPVIHENLLLLTFDGADKQYVAALDKVTGKTVWKKDRAIKYPNENGDFKKAYSTPTLIKHNGKVEVISPAAEATIAYNAENGDEIWRVVHGGMNEASRPVVGHGLVFLTSGHTKNLLAVKQGTGDLSQQIGWKTNKGVPTRPSLLLHGDLLFMISDEGITTCVDAKTGEQYWQERLGKRFSASPILAGGNLYFCDEEGKTHIVAAEKTYKLVAVNALDVGCMASPALVGDTLFIRTKTHLYAIGK